MTLAQASLALTVPFKFANNNCVQDAQWRLREALALAGQMRTANELAPGYVVKAVNDLNSWLN